MLVHRAHDPSGLWQESRALGATISGMRHRYRLRSETGWAEFGYFLCYFKMGCSQSSRFPTAGQGEQGSGNEIGLRWEDALLPSPLPWCR